MQPDSNAGSTSSHTLGEGLSQARILIIEDEPGMRHFLGKSLQGKCLSLHMAENTAQATGLISHINFDLVILDNYMEGQHGIEWLSEQRARGFFPPAILITAYADMETAIQALQAGASDFLLKPFRTNQLLTAIASCLERERLRQENRALRQELRNSVDQGRLRDELIGSSTAIEDVRHLISRVAPTPSSVLITGASGTGKEVSARMIHMLSDRSTRPFIPVNCAAIPPDMLETELFGYLKGSFPGAGRSRQGLFMSAHGGTLFLDGITEFSVMLQAKLLRAIESHCIRPLGSEQEVPVDVRLLFAANTDLDAAVKEGRLRQDLLHRINAFHIHMPPLHARESDIFDLAGAFMDDLSHKLGMPPVPITERERVCFATYDWPGNVRELRNTIERAVILGRFPHEISPAESQRERDSQTLSEIERRAILGTLAALNGDREAAASRLGISRKTIDRRLSEWNG